jgi:hypothetical protein
LHQIVDIFLRKYSPTYKEPKLRFVRPPVHCSRGSDEGGKENSIHVAVMNDVSDPDYFSVPL